MIPFDIIDTSIFRYEYVWLQQNTDHEDVGFG